MDELYQAQILALARVARSHVPLAHPSHHATVKNPLCGDEISLTLTLSAEIICDLHIAVKGCALCEAGAGFLLEQAKGAKLSDVTALHSALDGFLKASDTDGSKSIFSPFTPLRAVKNRHKCVMLAFQACQNLTAIS